TPARPTTPAPPRTTRPAASRSSPTSSTRPTSTRPTRRRPAATNSASQRPRHSATHLSPAMSDPNHPESAESLARARRYFAESVDELEDAGAERMTWTMSRDSSLRLDKYVQGRLKGISRSQVQKLIDLGAVTVNGK